MNIGTRCLRVLQGQCGYSGHYLSLGRLMSFQSPISLNNLYPSSSLKITTPTEVPKKPGEKFNGFIPMNQLEITYCRSSGPGGQHVNKVNTKVDMRFQIDKATWIDQEIREKLKTMCKNQITMDGYLYLSSDKTRSQQLNTAHCVEKLRNLIWQATDPEPKELDPEDEAIKIRRMETANRERLKQKRARSDVKKSRSAPKGDLF